MERERTFVATCGGAWRIWCARAWWPLPVRRGFPGRTVFSSPPPSPSGPPLEPQQPPPPPPQQQPHHPPLPQQPLHPSSRKTGCGGQKSSDMRAFALENDCPLALPSVFPQVRFFKQKLATGYSSHIDDFCPRGRIFSKEGGRGNVRPSALASGKEFSNSSGCVRLSSRTKLKCPDELANQPEPSRTNLFRNDAA